MPTPTQSHKHSLWSRRLADFESSRLSVAQFCQSIGCSVPSFYQWKRKLEQAPMRGQLGSTRGLRIEEPTRSQSAFVQVHTSDTRSESIEVKLPSGVSIFVPVNAIESLKSILDQVA